MSFDKTCSVPGCGRLRYMVGAVLCSDHGLVAESIVTPELVDAAARAWNGLGSDWGGASPLAVEIMRAAAQRTLTAVVPVLEQRIGQASRADELRKQADVIAAWSEKQNHGDYAGVLLSASNRLRRSAEKYDPPARRHNPCCSSHGVPMSCAYYRRTHFVEIRPCCDDDARRLSAPTEES